MSKQFRFVLGVHGEGTQATADQALAALVEFGYTDAGDQALASDEGGKGEFSAGSWVEFDTEAEAIDEAMKWDPEGGPAGYIAKLDAAVGRSGYDVIGFVVENEPAEVTEAEAVEAPVEAPAAA